MGATAEPTTDDEIDEMISALEGGETQEPEVEEEPEPEPDSEQTEDSEQPEPQTEEEVQAAEEAEDSEQEESSRVQELEEKINQLEEQLSSQSEEEEEPEGSEEEQQTSQELELDISFDGEDFVDEETHAEALSNAETFNEFLASFAEDIAARTQEEILQKFPQIVDQRVQQRTRQEVVMQRFWSENQDLKDDSKRKVLATKAQEVRSENPDLSLEETVQEAASRTREELDLGEKAEEIDQDAQENPAFAPDQGTGPSPSQEDTRDDQTKQIDEMIDAIG